MSIRLWIDDREVLAEPGERILEVAQRQGISIPTLCHHPALPVLGACRVCLVEVQQGKRREITTACNTLVQEGMRVATDTAEVRGHRAMNLELLRARAPEAPAVRELATQLGVARSRFRPPAQNPLPNCILCELCVRACAHLGHHALAAVGRGDKKRIGLPHNRPAEACVGCGSCLSVCPTRCILLKETATTRTIWGQTFELVRCKSCGAPVMTEAQRAHAIRTKQLPEDHDDTCELCKQSAASQRLASVVW
ncbi:MAG TPA: 2Fe-2S iron-sulfur cluster-binding protein [Myxococcota bacterium]|nr:2Fe-2S iron-sulfur cluster-binding protein [Myxococcota bacterium]HRY96815.1 2Fe-2S iron-sulfur cluster-binding protein [Myxococcota bacterium]HSA23776.1 2Fe-2S iron-sulfur cluster-binding protein [Myxococcota bacterium]